MQQKWCDGLWYSLPNNGAALNYLEKKQRKLLILRDYSSAISSGSRYSRVKIIKKFCDTYSIVIGARSTSNMDVIFPILVVLTVIQDVMSVRVNIAAILPEDPLRLFSLQRISPAIEYAIDYLHNHTTLLQGHTLRVTYRDSNCSSADGMNQAIKLYMASQVDVFLGPVCDFSVAPVARQARFWNLPLISVGAMARDFIEYRFDEYPLLTRAGPVNFDSLSDFFITIFKKYNWNRYLIIYDKEGQGEYLDLFCHLVSSSLHYDINEKVPNIVQDYHKIGRLDLQEDYMLPKQVGLQYSGKIAFLSHVKWIHLELAQQTHTSLQRQYNVAATSRRCSDVVVTLCVYWKSSLG